MKFLTGPALGLLLCLAANTASAQEADLSVTLNASQSAPNPGDRITFLGTVKNNGPDVSQLAAVPGSLLVGEIIATPTTSDPDLTNNNTTATMTVVTAATPQSADLAITITDGSTTMMQGGQAAYDLWVTNTGPDSANATLNFPLPSALTFVSLSSPGGWTCTTPAIGTNGTITCNRPAMPAGTSAQFIVKTQLSASTAAGAQIVSSATVTTTATDPYTGNNSATDVNTIIAVPIAAVPTLTEWAMILFGTLLAGSAALHLQRRRRTV